MAQKRMFDKRITDSDKFTDLPNSTKALYFMAGMSADDRGFFQPRRLQKMCGFTDDDFKVLIAKRFFMSFESGVMVITDWNKNNYLDKNRITETEYLDELNLLRLINERYELAEGCLTDVKPMFNQNSIEENRLIENSIDKNNIGDGCYIETNCNNVVTESNNVTKYIEENFGRTISPIEYEKIKYWLESFSEEMIKEAIAKSVLAGKKTFSYVQGILKNWKTNNITRIEETTEQTTPELPKWFGEDIQKGEISPEEKKELDDIIASFE